MKQKFNLLVTAVLLLTLAVACNLSPATSQPTVDSAALDTMVAQTVAASGIENQPAQPTSSGSEDQPGEVVEDTQVPATETATNTPEPTATFTETPTPTQEATLPVGLDDLDLGDPEWTHAFTNKGVFFTYSDSDSKVAYNNGKLEFTIFDALSYTIWSYSTVELEDFYFEITVQMPDNCKPKDRGGIMFGTPLGETNEGYVYQISCDGEYRLFLWDGSTTTNLVNWTKTDELEAGSGKSNRIGVLRDGKKIVLYVNGQKMDELTDNTYVGKGRIGVNMGVDDHDNVTVKFDDAAYWTDLP